jgi:hypothetical protein
VPAPPASRPPFLTPGASAFRHSVERRSATALLFMRSLPKALPPLVVIGLLAGGVLLHGSAAAGCFLAVMALFGWLFFLSWPALAPPARLVRLAVMTMMAFGVVLNATR